MPAPKTITESIQLAIEGRSAEIFFEALLRNMDLKGMQLQNFGGTSELSSFLKALRNVSGFDSRVVSLGIVRDAEDNPTGAFQSVCSALSKANFAVPPQPETPAGSNPRIIVLILPNAATPGMLETLCLESVANLPIMACVDDYFDCIESLQEPMPANMNKARVQAFLASRERPGLLLGQAAARGYWSWDSPAFDHIKLFLFSLLGQNNQP